MKTMVKIDVLLREIPLTAVYYQKSWIPKVNISPKNSILANFSVNAFSELLCLTKGSKKGNLRSPKELLGSQKNLMGTLKNPKSPKEL